MTLDIAKFISNSIRSQAKIQHLDISTKTTKAKDVPQPVAKMIADEYGDDYILDANYIAFFWGSLSKDEIQRLFNVVDKALGKSANKLTETDFKKLPYHSGNDSSGDGESKEEIDIEVDNSDDNDQEIDDDVDDDEEVEVDDDVDDDEEVEVDDDVDDDDDDDKEKLDEDEKSPSLTSYFFLKITTK